MDSFREEFTGHTSVTCLFWGLGSAEQDRRCEACFFLLQAELEMDLLWLTHVSNEEETRQEG